jgi:hypothetical protein
MKLLFVENRYATWIYRDIAKALSTSGFEIHWLVQNPVFAPDFGQVHLMPFPPATARHSQAMDGAYDWLSRTDRGVLHFGVNTGHYPHYAHHIEAVLDTVQPDFVFGEATEFHELLTLHHARKRGIRYLSPNATRYPSDRLAFMSYDTLNPVGGDGSRLDDAAAATMLDGIRHRKVIPSYMRPAEQLPRHMALTRLADKLRITRGWIGGERYVTPSPARKLALNAAQRQAWQDWELRSATTVQKWTDLLRSGKAWVLYALQMQPEGNIDVWGSPWNKQAEIVQRAARALQRCGATLVVKPNPKSKYEMSTGLNQAMESEPNIIGLPHATPMKDVFPATPLVMAVTGTVLMECVFSGKPVAGLGSHAMLQYPGVTSIDSPEALPAVLAAAKAGEANVASTGQAQALLQEIHAASYDATLWDPVAQPHFATPERITKLVAAFRGVIDHCRTNQQAK